MRCAAITRAGERCKAEATLGSYCWNHAPETAEARRLRARKAGRSGGNGRSSGLSELAETKRAVRGVIGSVLGGKIERSTAAVVFQGVNTLLKAVETERRLREQEEILERLEALEATEPRGDSRAWPR